MMQGKLAVSLEFECLESVLNLELPLNLVSITWLHSRDPQTCLRVRVCFSSVSDSGNKNWRWSDSARHFAKAAKHPCRTRAHQVKLLKLKEQWGQVVSSDYGQGRGDRAGGLSHSLFPTALTADTCRSYVFFPFSISFSLSKCLKAM